MEECQNMVLDETCLNHEEFSLCLLGKVKEFSSLTNIKVVLDDETKKRFQFNLAVSSWFSQIIQAHNDFVIDERVIWVEVEGIPCMTCWVRTIEVAGWVPNFKEDGEEGYDVNDGSHEKDMYGGVSENLKDVEGKSDRKEVPETNFEGVLNKKRDGKNIDDKHEDSFKCPPGFTPNEEGDVLVEKVDNWSDENRVNDGQEDGVCVGQHVHEPVEVSNDTHESTYSGHFKKSEVPRKGGSILELIDDFVNAEQTMGYDMIGYADGHRRREVVRLIQEVDKVDAMEVAQKAKIKWSIEGDQNSKYYHGVLNKKRGRLTIREVLVDVPNANMVKDFRPISLIGSLCKVIPKVLVNRLVTVLDDIFDEIQSAFVTDRQIMDGPFISNEIVHWCKNKKKQSGSVLVNGSPTKEFQFHKGLKQGDPLYPFLFILVMESLHVSFQRVVDAGLFNGIKLDSSLQISHLFYADDAIFMGQWSQSFFNDADVNSKKPSSVRWKSVLAAKDVGGLGVSSLFALNRALMFKWVWRFFSQKNSLWVRVVKALHGRMRKLLGNGVNSLFWDVAWCGDIAFKNLVPRLYALESMKNIEVASKLSHGGLKFSFRRNSRGRVEQAQFERLKEMVEGVTLSNSNDRWSWSLVGSGDFSVSSVRKLIDNAILPKGISKMRWIKEVPIKINVHAWKVIHDCLPTRFNIFRRGIEIESILCPMCECSVESSRHLFFSCKMISDVMHKITRWWDLEYREINSFEDWCQWISSIRLPVNQKHVFEGICYIV
uniref:RNA-directed DNA polymerase, eukaryota, reverse transcriptase zinc-binding domain protein n=1 Tax=Tanacetum cinerariifolium TaxID=118510 RepID=A0A6L2MZC9_TANCI|nr:RNA-directed DNA polymerase, eukaryota, reverse transcriptase zinc-binding domain protein [Tanacetum cinerariifolium]